MTENLPNEVHIEINDNSTSYNHNISIRITDGSKQIDSEKLTKIALERAKEIRKMVLDGDEKNCPQN